MRPDITTGRAFTSPRPGSGLDVNLPHELDFPLHRGVGGRTSPVAVRRRPATARLCCWPYPRCARAFSGPGESPSRLCQRRPANAAAASGVALTVRAAGVGLQFPHQSVLLQHPQPALCVALDEELLLILNSAVNRHSGAVTFAQMAHPKWESVACDQARSGRAVSRSPRSP